MSYCVNYVGLELKRASLTKKIRLEGTVFPEDKKAIKDVYDASAKNIKKLFETGLARNDLNAFDAMTIAGNPQMRADMCLWYLQIKEYEKRGVGIEKIPHDLSYGGISEDAKKVNIALVELGNNGKFVLALEQSKNYSTRKLAKELRSYAQEFEGRPVISEAKSGLDIENMQIVSEMSEGIRSTVALNYADRWKYQI